MFKACTILVVRLQERYSLIEGQTASKIFYLEACTNKPRPGTESCAPLVNPVYTTEFESLKEDQDMDRSACGF